MKAFNRICLFVIMAICAVFIGANTLLLTENYDSGRPYRVEISRLAQEMENGETPDFSSCEYVTLVYQL